MSLFDKEKDEMLIKLVKTKPVIYDKGHPQHRNLIAKHTEWKDISTAMDVPIADIQKRWKHFRDHYKKKKKLKSKKNTWKYMPLLEFLSAPSKLPQRDNRNPWELAQGKEQEQSRELTSELSDISLVSESEDLDVPRADTPLPETDIKTDNYILTELNNKIIAELKYVRNLAGPSTSFDNLFTKKRKPEGSSVIARLETMRRNMKYSKKVDIRNEMPTELESAPSSGDSLHSSARSMNEDIVDSDVFPVNRYFEAVAEIVSMLPPHLVSDTKLKIHKSIYQIELISQGRGEKLIEKRREGYESV